jgi:anhydro-N-acetylmuramic acid kinase
LHYLEKHYDDNALLASQGRIDQALLNALMSNAFFTRPFPKTTGPELFSLCYLNNAISSSESTGLSNEDILATLCEFTAQTISNALSKTFANDQAFKVYLSGGGMHNPLLVQGLSRLLNIELNNTGDLQLNPDAKEAVLFALLANECVAGGRLNFHGRPGLPSISMGKISLPE